MNKKIVMMVVGIGVLVVLSTLGYSNMRENSQRSEIESYLENSKKTIRFEAHLMQGKFAKFGENLDHPEYGEFIQSNNLFCSAAPGVVESVRNMSWGEFYQWERKTLLNTNTDPVASLALMELGFYAFDRNKTYDGKDMASDYIVTFCQKD